MAQVRQGQQGKAGNTMGEHQHRDEGHRQSSVCGAVPAWLPWKEKKDCRSFPLPRASSWRAADVALDWLHRQPNERCWRLGPSEAKNTQPSHGVGPPATHSVPRVPHSFIILTVFLI